MVYRRKIVMCMTRLIVGAALGLGLLLHSSHAQEQGVLTVTGRLSGYGMHMVIVDGDKIELCEDYEVLDCLDRQISLDGLIATETVQVTLTEACAVAVKAMRVRK